MATLRSFRGYQRTFRERNDAVPARATPRITDTSEGLPCLDIEIRGEERIFRLILSPEETDSVTRTIYRSMAHGMNQLRAKYEPEELDERPRLTRDAGDRIHAVAVKHGVALREPVVRDMVAYLLREEEPGDPRCDGCDNGLHVDWLYCPYCGEATALGDNHGPAAQMLARINALDDALRAVRVKALPAGAAVGLQREGWEDRCREVLDIIDAVLPRNGEG